MENNASFSGKRACGPMNTAHFTPLQADKVSRHPCYSPLAHHRYARMHLAVAPACNLQCNYCNRKYDCSNESRPGVVSELLSPEQAIAKARYVASQIPQLSVIGIAGPGDPLANLARTFKTLEGLRTEMPDIKLCLSTNGLMLPDVVDRLVDLGVDHVTVTVNAIDAVIAEKIYDGLWYEGDKLHGRIAADLLIERQGEGIRRLAERGIMVKVNSVLIPEINAAHLGEVSLQVRQWGAVLHNVMPLIARPEHGTKFGLEGVREPSVEELGQARSHSGRYMPQMAHCQQCRADAIGMLGDDRSQEFPLASLPEQQEPKLTTLFRRASIQASIASQGESEEPDACLVAVATGQGDVIDQHFGHVDRFHIYSISRAGIIPLGERFTQRYCKGPADCEEQEPEDRLEQVIALLADVKAVFCARIGLAPWQRLESAGIEPDVNGAWRPVRETLEQWRAQRIQPEVSQQGVA
ncbi:MULTISPECIES: nitrogenase cofactor biosynthesis protein NifB [unclassified Brenneria]|uniref:nitrogenase cofactor biosynthesis protein NifB n=1 Tax=unclassified Brenneria TaxID=2634434 RepID=UPI001555A06D|nr:MULTISPECIES: nitrogenase cofactor biosynthesis protein NifB [unclassified Brenneria]MBJ7220842.1 nitrogenase cofactor biosynthesis protein NifB [Brenneria sp. L3-3C-1]MEE3642081.1 nitrogenase cofactor biosynthesis protein NifB [Brenneria sp. L3_3C_1]MEE3649221.1 nitrogenase cofactor biosynthesis protein NifB [Brenneria sp. HEZEL_4_2_4]NPC99174.1 nitrogenase cofactor biosynthesis protein NifB [Brenneria sp. hezel4-2-4]